MAQGSVPLWRYLCAEWNSKAPYGQRALRFNFFLLSADILVGPKLPYGASPGAPRMQRNESLAGSSVAFGPPRKRLLAAYTCD